MSEQRNSTVTVDYSGGGAIAHVRLNRPEKKNSLTLHTLDELVSITHRLCKDRNLRVVILSGEGDTFSAGLDFGSAMRSPSGIAKAFAPRPWRGTNTFQEATWGFRRLPVPVIAAVQGHCLGGGLQLALAADYRFTTPDATWSVLEAKWGLIPDMSGVHSLSSLVGQDVAKRLAMTGEMISGERAVNLGLASELAADPEAAALELARELIGRSPDSVAQAKKAFDRTWHLGPRATFATERLLQARLLVADNTRRAREAAAKKAAPVFAPRRVR